MHDAEVITGLWWRLPVASVISQVACGVNFVPREYLFPCQPLPVESVNGPGMSKVFHWGFKNDDLLIL